MITGFAKRHEGENITGRDLIGREINIMKGPVEVYYALVLWYYPEKDSYRVVYMVNDKVEEIKLGKINWSLRSRRKGSKSRSVLEGAVVKFKSPKKKGHVVEGMIYAFPEQSHGEDFIRVVHLDEDIAEFIPRSSATQLTNSPCESL